MGDKDEETKRGLPPAPVADHSTGSPALALQNQEREFTLESSDSEAESENADIESEGSDRIFRNYQRLLANQGQLDFLEGEDSNSDEDMEEDDIDPDELSYEQLIALGEIVGEESRGLSADEISSSLHPFVFHVARCKTLVDRCVICQVEYREGETMVGLPCDHPYHLDCISKWLQIRKICPICSSEVSSTPTPKIAELNK